MFRRKTLAPTDGDLKLQPETCCTQFHLNYHVDLVVLIYRSRMTVENLRVDVQVSSGKQKL